MPVAPTNADFAIYIDFEPSSENPERIFQAADEVIKSLRELDRILCKAVDSNIEPIMLLEEIQTGSLKVWLRNKLEIVDVDSLKNLDWRSIVGKFLVESKYAVIEWTNKNPEDVSNIENLQKDVVKLAEETGVRKLPFYGEINTNDITNISKNINKAKALLSESDKMKYLTKDDEIEFNLGLQIDTDNIQELLTKETIASDSSELILVVKKPDYLGASKWDFKHGTKTISASIDDSDWLNEFQSRKIDVRPGDALRCSVRIEVNYGFDNEVLSENFTIKSVVEVLKKWFSLNRKSTSYEATCRA